MATAAAHISRARHLHIAWMLGYCVVLNSTLGPFSNHIYLRLVVDEDFLVTVRDVEVLRGNTAIVRYV